MVLDVIFVISSDKEDRCFQGFEEVQIVIIKGARVKKITADEQVIVIQPMDLTKKPNEHIFIPLEAIHRIQNPGKKPVKIMEAQVGSILKETDIVRYQDVYGRVK